jgi:hypothetical protein
LVILRPGGTANISILAMEYKIALVKNCDDAYEVAEPTYVSFHSKSRSRLAEKITDYIRETNSCHAVPD